MHYDALTEIERLLRDVITERGGRCIRDVRPADQVGLDELNKLAFSRTAGLAADLSGFALSNPRAVPLMLPSAPYFLAG